MLVPEICLVLTNHPQTMMMVLPASSSLTNIPVLQFLYFIHIYIICSNILRNCYNCDTTYT